jgi:hypothetical protein
MFIASYLLPVELNNEIVYSSSNHQISKLTNFCRFLALVGVLQQRGCTVLFPNNGTTEAWALSSLA